MNSKEKILQATATEIKEKEVFLSDLLNKVFGFCCSFRLCKKTVDIKLVFSDHYFLTELTRFFANTC